MIDIDEIIKICVPSIVLFFFAPIFALSAAAIGAHLGDLCHINTWNSVGGCGCIVCEEHRNLTTKDN